MNLMELIQFIFSVYFRCYRYFRHSLLSFEPCYRFRYKEYGRKRKNVNTRNAQSDGEPKVVWSIVKQIICTILGILGIFVLSVAGFYIFRSLSPICEDKECLDVDCSDSCNHCKNYKRISIDGDLNVTKSSCLGINERNCTRIIYNWTTDNWIVECQPVMSLVMIGGFSVNSSLSKNYNFAFPQVLNTHFEFENGPVPRDENIIQNYLYGLFPKEGRSTSFCSVKIQDEIFILGGNATNGNQGINVLKIERKRSLHLEDGRFVPTRHQIVQLDWKLPLPFIKHVCSAVRNFEIWLCSTDAQIDHGGITCVATTIDGKQSKRQYLSHAHVSGNLITIKDGASESLVIIGGRNARVPGEANIIAKDEVEFCDEGMSLTRLEEQGSQVRTPSQRPSNGAALVSSRPT